MLSRALGDLHLAEDAVQEAYISALERWPRDGVPNNPLAWIVTTARNRALDVLRRRSRGEEKMALLARLESTQAQDESEFDERSVPDDQLGLIFACTHPALGLEARIALTLRAVAGLTTEEIAHAFLVPVPTMAQRLVRAKQKIKANGISFAIPDAPHLRERLDAVCTTLYVMFNEGYAATTGDERVRHDLCNESARLARLLAELMPDQPEVHGLLALILLTDARRNARVDENGDTLTLEDQDRRKWDRWLIAAGLAHLGTAARFNDDGPYQIQAAIAAVHARAERFEKTNWRAIVTLYDRLYELDPSPIVALNRAAALAMLHGFERALVEVDGIASDDELDHYAVLHSTRAEMLRRIGRMPEAAQEYRRAIDLTENLADRRFLERRLESVLQ